MLKDASWISKLASFAIMAPSADNSQPWTLSWDKGELAIAFRKTYQMPSMFWADSHATLLAAGAVAELLHNTFIANNVTAKWHWPSNSASGKPYAWFTLNATPSDFTPPEGVSLRHTNRFAFRCDPLPPAVFREIEQFREGSIRIVPVSGGQHKSEFIRLVRLSSEARFCTRELHEWLIDSLRFTQEEVSRGDGLDVRTLALPPGGKQFMRFISDWRRMKILNRLSAYKILALSEVRLLPAAPALLCIVGPADARSAIDAGRLMTRLWMHLNLNEIAVHPYYVVTDQINRLHEDKVPAGFESQIDEVEEQTRELLGLQPAEILHIIFRVGYPKVTPLRSRRLPLDAVFIDNS